MRLDVAIRFRTGRIGLRRLQLVGCGAPTRGLRRLRAVGRSCLLGARDVGCRRRSIPKLRGGGIRGRRRGRNVLGRGVLQRAVVDFVRLLPGRYAFLAGGRRLLSRRDRFAALPAGVVRSQRKRNGGRAQCEAGSRCDQRARVEGHGALGFDGSARDRRRRRVRFSRSMFDSKPPAQARQLVTRVGAVPAHQAPSIRRREQRQPLVRRRGKLVQIAPPVEMLQRRAEAQRFLVQRCPGWQRGRVLPEDSGEELYRRTGSKGGLAPQR